MRIKLSDGSSWPRPAMESDDDVSAAWKARYVPDQLTQADLFELAEIAEAYGYLVVESSRATRDLVAREVRAALESEA